MKFLLEFMNISRIPAERDVASALFGFGFWVCLGLLPRWVFFKITELS